MRLTGQDVGRGTFSHRHAVLHNQKDGSVHVPLQHLGDAQAPFDIHDSLLSASKRCSASSTATRPRRRTR